ncbi:MAG: YerC/YecD family TrpR-related protein [Candidatus Nomurabacteria bacterium]|nr:YerC/YecD family TrpR-related protein [Candidatus Nomurabacteria bacterium]
MSKGMNDKTSIKTVREIMQIGGRVDWNEKKNNQLIEAILALKNENEAKRFLRDLMTEKEIKEFANRLEAAFLLSKDAQYNVIMERTGLSSTTIARISKWLKSSLGGYRLVLSRLSSHHTPSKLGKGLHLNS